MKPTPVKIKPMKLNVRKMRANNLNNFDLSNMPDDVQINADGDVPPAAGAGATTATTPRFSLESIQKGIDTVNAAANLARSVQIRKADEVCGKRPLITTTSAGKAKLKAYNDCMASKGLAAPAAYVPDAVAPPPVEDNKILGMPKPLFFGILGVLVLGGGFLAYRKFSK